MDKDYQIMMVSHNKALYKVLSLDKGKGNDTIYLDRLPYYFRISRIYKTSEKARCWQKKSLEAVGNSGCSMWLERREWMAKTRDEVG